MHASSSDVDHVALERDLVDIDRDDALLPHRVAPHLHFGAHGRIVGEFGDAPPMDDLIDIRALVLGDAVGSVSARIDDGPEVRMHALTGRPGRWAARLRRPGGGQPRIVVTAVGRDGAEARDEIRAPAGGWSSRTVDDNLGRHENSIGAWPEHHLLGTRLGPNANGRKW